MRPHKMELNAATRLLAGSVEDAIRQAVSDAPGMQLKRPFPIVVNFNNRQVPFICQIDKLPSGSEQARGILSKVYLTTVKWGLLMRGDPKSWISDPYTLDGKNNFKPAGLPRTISEQEAEQFFHTCGVPVPPHA